MKVEDVLLRATAGKIMWWQAAETIGISDRQIEPVGWRGTMARLQVIAPHLDATITLTIGTRRVRGYCVEGMLFRI